MILASKRILPEFEDADILQTINLKTQQIIWLLEVLNICTVQYSTVKYDIQWKCFVPLSHLCLTFYDLPAEKMKTPSSEALGLAGIQIGEPDL